MSGQLEDAFGFVDPADVLRSCHIIPAFCHGPCREDGEEGISEWARDSEDAKAYYVGRYVPNSRLNGSGIAD